MKQITLLLSLFFILGACNTSKEAEIYLPESVRTGIHFGMTLEDFKTLKGDKVKLEDDGMSFRIIYSEAISNNPIEYVIYYFDADEEKPLYEVILIYKDEADRDAAAAELLGAPNFEEKEWRIEREKKETIWAWTFKNKLIVTALIPKTEWYEDVYGK